jgi:hypothetical protein
LGEHQGAGKCELGKEVIGRFTSDVVGPTDSRGIAGWRNTIAATAAGAQYEPGA